jgi:alpha-N-arabinofuranosidase
MNPIQATGHADLFEDHQGNWWAVFLGIRYADQAFHNLGRETFLAPVDWTAEDWPVVNLDERVRLEMKVPRDIAPQPWPAEPTTDHFDTPKLGFDWVFLRNPKADDWSLTARGGWLRLRCSPVTLDDLDSPAAVLRRQKHFECRVRVVVDFWPHADHEEAGLTALLDNQHHAEVVITRRDGRRVVLLRRRIGTMMVETGVESLPDGHVELYLETTRTEYRFGYIANGAPKIVGVHALRYLSTEVAGGYTGVMLGLYATAKGHGSDNAAHFDAFTYEA